MSKKLRCPGCSTLFQLPSDLAGTKLACPGCKKSLALPASVQNLRPAKAVAAAPAVKAAPTGKHASTPTKPRPPRKYFNLAAVVGGGIVVGAAEHLLDGIVLLIGVDLEAVRVPIVGGSFFCAIFGGFFVAAVASHRKIRHTFWTGVLSASVWALYVLVSEASNPSWLEIAITGFLVLFFIFSGVLIGGFLETGMTALTRMLFPRRQWIYRTSSNKEIVALDPWRHPVLAFSWRVVGCVVIAAGLVEVAVAVQAQSKDGLWGAITTLVVLGKVCFILARRHSAKPAREALRKDKRPPIVYLRSFRDDGRTENDGWWHQWTQGAKALLRPSLEERLVKVLSGYGPVIAIGAPDDELPELGAARMYVSDDDWQEVVRDLLAPPDTMVLLQAGETWGLRWELNTVVHHMRTDQVVVFLPFAITSSAGRRDEQYAAFRAWAQKCLPAPLPDQIGDATFLFFRKSPAWETHILEPSARIPKKHLLADVLEDLQECKELHPPESHFRRNVILLAVLLAILIVVLVVGAVQKVREAAARTAAARAAPPHIPPATPKEAPLGSLPAREEAVAKLIATLGPEHPDTLTGINDLAEAYQIDGQLVKALPLFEETLAKRKANLGPDHADTLISMNNLGNAYVNDGNLAKAIPLLEEALAKRKARLGPDHTGTLLSMYNLAAAYRVDGQLPRALRLFEDTLAQSKITYGFDHSETLDTMNILALTYLDARDPDRAIPLFNEMLAVKRKQLGDADPRFASELASVGLELLGHGQYATAEPMLRECLQIRTKKEADAWSTFNTKSMLGASLLGQKKYEDAEPLLKEGYEGMKHGEKTMPAEAKVRVTEALERLVQLYDATGNAAEAERWRKELAARKAAEKEPKK